MRRRRCFLVGLVLVGLSMSCGQVAEVAEVADGAPTASAGERGVTGFDPPPGGRPPGWEPPIPLSFGESYEFSIGVEDGLLLVQSFVQEDPPEQPNLRFDRPLIAGQDAWALYLSTGAQHHTVDVMLTVDQGPPPRQAGWDMTDETSVELSTDSFTISSLYAHDVKEWRLPEPGSWRVRLSRSGADRSRDPESTADGGDREQWLLEWWRSG